jgi:stage IV sporulation protein FB
MTWSFRLGRILGTEVKIHFTFLLLIAWLGITSYQQGGTAVAIAETGFMLALFTCVLLHEFGHILMARHFGVRTPDVILLPIGGVARLERIPEEPKQEFLIALAGPAVTLTIALALYAYLTLFHGGPAEIMASLEGGDLVSRLMWVNGILLLFNLLPAFPMDGGRVLRAVLASRLGLLRATRIAAAIGQGLAILLGMAGLFATPSNPIWILIALFVFLGAGQEAAAVATRVAGKGVGIERMMVTRFDVLPIHARLQAAVDLLLAGEQREFPVVDNLGRVEGLLTRENLIKGLSQRGPESTVGEAMTPQVPLLPLGLNFDTALNQLRASGLPALPVVDSAGALVGLLTTEHISNLILVRQALRQA